MLAAFEGTLEQIYGQVSPSVVTIETAQTAATPRGRSTGNTGVLQGLGSGFVWDTDGHIVTNNHVVAGANILEVVFADGSTVSAKITGADPQSDLAVLQVSSTGMTLQPLKVGDSARLKVGQLAVAIGNPYGEQNTMTTGIISAVGRTLPAEIDPNGATYSIPDVIQTDAAINPGNSGGVLVDGNAQVIGVTAALESAGQASAGIGFAIPSNIVKKVVPQLIQSGHAQHPWLGISGTSLTPDLAKAMNLQASQRGALVVDVVSGSSAEKAGLQPSTQTASVFGQTVKVGGDVITAIDSQPVRTIDDLITYLTRNTDVGQTVSLNVLRGNTPQTIDVKLAARPDTPAVSSANP